MIPAEKEVQWDRESVADEALFGIDSIWQLTKRARLCEFA